MFNLFSWFRTRDKPSNRTAGSGFRPLFGGSTSGKAVTERSAMQMTAVYACVRILAESIAGLPLHVYQYNNMLSEIKESIINAYERKTGLSRAKLSRLMDAETWMDAGKDVELGFPDEILAREGNIAAQDAILYSENTGSRKLWNKLAEKYKEVPKGRNVQELLRDLSLAGKLM